LWIAVFSTIGIVVPIEGTVDDAKYVAQISPAKEIPVKLLVVDRTVIAADNGVLVQGEDGNGEKALFLLPAVPPDFGHANGYIVRGRWDSTRMRVSAVVSGRPIISFPYIAGLEERARIIFFHVPMAWLTAIAFLVAMWFGIRYLRKGGMMDDVKSSASAGLGLLFCVLATVTGSIWAKFNWESFWNWDPRETSIFVLLLVYGAYFTLRAAVEDAEKRARLSAVYSILAFVTVPFLVFILPRVLPGLHPGSVDDVNAGPVLSKQGMDTVMRIVLYSLLAGYVVLYAWLLNMRVRLHRIEQTM
jgi:heme exporter protein C